MRYEWVEIRPYIGVFLCVFNTLRDRMGERSGYPICGFSIFDPPATAQIRVKLGLVEQLMAKESDIGDQTGQQPLEEANHFENFLARLVRLRRLAERLRGQS